MARKAGFNLAVILALILPAAAQITVGENTNLNANGNIFFGYNGVYGNEIDSSHGLAYGGSGTVSGSYFNPNFLSFSVSPYYNESRANSQYQSTSNASGLTGSADIFSGSNFPGSVNYSLGYNSDSTFGIPSTPNYTAHGNNQNFGINWSERIPDMPSLTIGYQYGNNTYSIYGTDQEGNSSFHGLNVQSNYVWDDYNLGAFYSNSASHSNTPNVLAAGGPETATGDSNVFGFTAGHSLPWDGMWSAGFTRSDVNSDYAGYTFNGTIDSVRGSVGFQPTNKLHVGVSGGYSDNFAGEVYQSALATGGGTGASSGSASLISLPGSGQTSYAGDITGTVSYTILPNLISQGYVDRRMQSFLGESFASTVAGGGLSYARPLLGGNFNSGLNVQDSFANGTSSNGLGFSASAGYSRKVDGWRLSGSILYAQNVETMLITEMTSYYTANASASRRWGRFSASLGVGFSHSGLTNQAATANQSRSYTAGIGWRQYLTLSGSYSESSGNGVLTSGGVVNTPLPPVIPPELLILYNGKSYSIGVGSAPKRKLSISAAYAHSAGNTFSGGVLMWNKAEIANAQLQYQFRKMYFNAGYSRLMQGFNGPMGSVSSYFFGVGRWFNFF